MDGHDDLLGSHTVPVDLTNPQLVHLGVVWIDNLREVYLAIQALADEGVSTRDMAAACGATPRQFFQFVLFMKEVLHQ